MDNMNKVAKKLPGRLCTFLCTGLIGIGVVLFYAILPVAFIVVGAIYWDASNCRAENLQALLIIGGFLGLLCNVLAASERRTKKSVEKRTGFWLRILSFVVAFATFCWLIAACVVVFRMHPNQHENKKSGDYCHEFLYDFSFYSLIVILALLIIHLIVLISIALCCAEKIIKILVRREAKTGVVNFISNA